MLTPCLLVPTEGTYLYKYILVEALEILGGQDGICATFKGLGIDYGGVSRKWYGGSFHREYSYNKPQALLRYVTNRVSCAPLEELFPGFYPPNGRDHLITICQGPIWYKGAQVKDIDQFPSLIENHGAIQQLKKLFKILPTNKEGVWVCGDYVFTPAPNSEKELRQLVIQLATEGKYEQVKKMLG